MTPVFPPSITDVHTHRRDAGPEAIINIAPGEPLRPDHFYSVGIHPRDAALDSPQLREAVSTTAARPEVIAIGEAGIDTVYQPAAPLSQQLELLRWHIALSERLQKPLILHAVRALEHVIALRRELKPSQPWIWHGFRGKPQMARQLVAHGIHVSINPATPPSHPLDIPAPYLHYESD